MSKMNEKIYPHNKIIVKKPEDIIAYDYVPPAAQQLFNFIVALAINSKQNIIKLKIADYFCWANIDRPQGKNYTIFYKNVEVLKHSFVTAQTIENNKKIKYEWPLIVQTKTIKTLKNKVENIEIILNECLVKYYKWQRANVPIDITETKKLNKKYAYKLFEFLRYQQRKISKNNYISVNDLRRILTVPSTEKNERFLRYLNKAIENINETTTIKVMGKIKTKNKKSLASAEIKFVNLTEKIAEKQYEFLIFERDFKQKNEE